MTVLSNNISRFLFAAVIASACSDPSPYSPRALTENSTPTREISSNSADTSEAGESLPEETQLSNSNELPPELPATSNIAMEEIANEPQVEMPVSACSTPNGVSGRPGTVSELLELINALPVPGTIACLLESLERPLELFMTSSTFSAQPAFYDSPRTFIFLGPLVLSIVPDGSSSNLLEFGQRTTRRRSIKGEIEFPVYQTVTEDTLLGQVRLSDQGSVCGACHVAEERLDNKGFNAAYESVIIVPNPKYEIEIEDFRERNRDCDYQYGRPRCEILDALFEHGEVRRTELWQ